MDERGVVRTTQPGTPVFTEDPFAGTATVFPPQTAPLPHRTNHTVSTATFRPRTSQPSFQPRRGGPLDIIVENPSSEKSSVYSEGQPSRSNAFRRKTSPSSIQRTPQSVRGHPANSFSTEDRTPETPIRGQSSQDGQQGRVHGSRDPTPEVPEEMSHTPDYYPPTDTRHSVSKHSASKSLRDDLRAGSEVEVRRHAHLDSAFDIDHVLQERQPLVPSPRGHARKQAVEETKRLHGTYNELITPTNDRAGRAVVPVDIPPVPCSTSNNSHRPSTNSVHTTVEPGRAVIPVDIQAVSSSTSNDPYRQSPNSVHTTMDSAVGISPEDVRKLTPQELRDRTVISQPSFTDYSSSSPIDERDVVHPEHKVAKGSASGTQKYALRIANPNTSF
jgi:hypothetical protein